MSRNLIIVESPNKIKTIKSYLGSDYEVIASYGHLREMDPKIGYNKKTYEPNWVVIQSPSLRTSKAKVIQQIIRAAEEADVVYLATDPDREGEAISWHIYDLLNLEDKLKCKRITFNEISKKAILSAIDEQHELDMNLVYSQFARRVVDRVVGYNLSELVRRTVRGKSAGRVQSVALMFIVNRELERRNFVPSKWYEISAELENGLTLSYTAAGRDFAKYQESDSSKYNFKFAKFEEAKQVVDELNNEFVFTEYLPERIARGDEHSPLTTDKMLQFAGNSLGWSASKTTTIAQQLFEGVEINGKHIGLITYPRTDSERINGDFIKSAQGYLAKVYGSNCVNYDYSPKVQKAKKKQENIQDAHEAIRPVNPNLSPDDIKSAIDDAAYRLYNIIWSRTMSVLMKRPIYCTKGMIFKNNGHEFYASHKQIQSKGYLSLNFYNKFVSSFEGTIPDLQPNQVYIGEAKLNEFDKQPPAYFTEASLIATLKDSGVGRPSTYAAMAKISETRGYVNKESQKLIPTDMGMKVIEELKKDFPEVVDSKFTANMETELDKIAGGDELWTAYLEKFAPEFEEKIKSIFKTNTEKKQKEVVMADRNCPECGSPLVIKESRFGTKFVACMGFPKCKYAEFNNNDSYTGEQCPECGGKLLKRYNKKQQMFIGCSSYPNCRYIKK